MKDTAIVAENAENGNVTPPEHATAQAAGEVLDAATARAEELDAMMQDSPTLTDQAPDPAPGALARATAQLREYRDTCGQRGDKALAEQLGFLLADAEAGPDCRRDDFLNTAAVIGEWHTQAWAEGRLDAAYELDGAMKLIHEIALRAFTPAQGRPWQDTGRQRLATALTGDEPPARNPACDPATWPTFDEALQRLRLREWLSYELAGVPEAGGYRVEPEWFEATIDELLNTYAIARQLYRGETPGPCEDDLNTHYVDGGRVFIQQQDQYGPGNLLYVLQPDGKPALATAPPTERERAGRYLPVGRVLSIHPGGAPLHLEEIHTAE